MPMFKPSNRRKFLRYAAGSAAAAVAGPTLGATSAGQPSPADQDGPSAVPIRALYRSLTADQRRMMCFEWDHHGFNERVGHPDNIFWYQAVLANRVFMALDEKQRARALVTRGMPYYEFDGRIDRQVIRPDTKLERPLEPDVRFRGADATFPGMP